MRDLVSCFSENSINVTHSLSSSSLTSSSSSCSRFNTSNACISPSLIPSIQTSITSIYRITLSSSKHLIIKVTWCNKNNHPPQSNNNGLSISVSSADQNPSTSLKLNTSSRFFRKKKGNKSVDSDLGKIEVFWDLSSAKYDSNLSPEPVQGFYVIVLVDSQLGLLLGDSSEETLRKKGFGFDFDFEKSLVSRQEHFSGNAFYSTKAKFAESGDSHEIVIRCNAEKTEGLKQSNHHHHHHHSPVLSVCVDKKTVTTVKRLQWNFRGNQTIFVDGLLVDLMWDVHDWFFSNPEGCGKAVFMFRTRNGLDSSRLWLEEKMVKKDEQDKLDFSLLIYACKT
ncbi:hypothetical protein EUTSA_v10016903mg [Eutrema salsugineum]|uniref:DUF868 domain-containing protein n=1 Tax=Eutrema salsugineum TaxID=72664 RepID=V4M857_EUTSA|nr:uncharacterized protein LOC18027318 [Eutrema salsugineum]ESQ51237.1 hypothetical protein EUTSA_v10016903mg [Eutrema salsugineum]